MSVAKWRRCRKTDTSPNTDKSGTNSSPKNNAKSQDGGSRRGVRVLSFEFCAWAAPASGGAYPKTQNLKTKLHSVDRAAAFVRVLHGALSHRIPTDRAFAYWELLRGITSCNRAPGKGRGVLFHRRLSRPQHNSRAQGFAGIYSRGRDRFPGLRLGPREGVFFSQI